MDQTVEIISNEGDHGDIELIFECHFLKAVAYYRLNRPMDAVNSFTTGKRIRKRMWEQFMEANDGDIKARAANDWSVRTISSVSRCLSINSSDIAAIDEVDSELLEIDRLAYEP
jgi:hypothetical protein